MDPAGQVNRYRIRQLPLGELGQGKHAIYHCTSHTVFHAHLSLEHSHRSVIKATLNINNLAVVDIDFLDLSTINLVFLLHSEGCIDGRMEASTSRIGFYYYIFRIETFPQAISHLGIVKIPRCGFEKATVLSF